MKAKQDTTRQAETAHSDEMVAGLGAAITIQSTDVVAKDEFAGHGGSYVFHPAIGLRTRANEDAVAVVEGAQ